jgi:hypothetical protein
MLSRRRRKSLSLLAKSAELAIAAPQVIAHRVTRMAIAGPTLSARDRKEFHLMVGEKVAGFGEAWSAMVLQTIRANQTLAVSLFRAFGAPSLRRRASTTAVAVQLQGAALDILAKGLAPIHRMAVGNAKRLARTKLR